MFLVGTAGMIVPDLVEPLDIGLPDAEDDGLDMPGNGLPNAPENGLLEALE